MEGMVNRGGDGDHGRSRVAITATGEVEQQEQQQELQPPRGISDVSLGGGLRPDRRSGEASEINSSTASSVLGRGEVSVNNPSGALEPVGAARVVNQEQRPDELIMKNVWLPWCGGREFIEFAAELTDLSKETFEA